MKSSCQQDGFSYIELMVSLVIVTVGIMGIMATTTSSFKLTNISKRETLAMNAAQQMIETIRNDANFAQIYANYNTDAADDPGGAGLSPGANFAVTGLSVAATDADGMAGRISFPDVNVGGVLQLREDIVNAEWGMTYDFRYDGVTDVGVDHKGDYTLLPVGAFVEWDEGGSTRSVVFRTFISAR